MVIGIGQSDDNTKALIEGIGDSKIKTFDSFWDTQKTKGGLILSEKTNEALEHCSNDWCFYIQADEVVHEMDLQNIYKSMETHEKNPDVQGLLFKYIHFYGSYSVIANSRKWYRNEIRVIKKSSNAKSHGDAQGFRIPPNQQKLKVAPANGTIYHYGWVKPPQKMGQKKKLLDRWWHGTKKDSENDQFEFDRQYGLRSFQGSHPAIMKELIKKQFFLLKMIGVFSPNMTVLRSEISRVISYLKLLFILIQKQFFSQFDRSCLS